MVQRHRVALAFIEAEQVVAELGEDGAGDLLRRQLGRCGLEFLDVAPLASLAEVAPVGTRRGVGRELLGCVLEGALPRHDLGAQRADAQAHGLTVGRGERPCDADHRNHGATGPVKSLLVLVEEGLDLGVRHRHSAVRDARGLPADPGHRGRVMRVLPRGPEMLVRNPDLTRELEEELLPWDLLAIVVLEVDEDPLLAGRRGREQSTILLDVESPVRLEFRRPLELLRRRELGCVLQLRICDADAPLLVFPLQEDVADQLLERPVVDPRAFVEGQAPLQLLFLLLGEPRGSRLPHLQRDIGTLDRGDGRGDGDLRATNEARRFIEQEATDEHDGDANPDERGHAPHFLQHGYDILTKKGLRRAIPVPAKKPRNVVGRNT